MKTIPTEVKQEAIRLRVEERLGIDEIRRLTGLSVGTLSMLLREYPLSSEEVQDKMSQSSRRNNPLRKYRPNLSKVAEMMAGQTLSTAQKGRAAEAAVAFRLAMLGYDVLRNMFEGSRVDFTVTRPGSDKYIRLQVKWAKRGIQGRPFFDTRNGEHGKVRRMSRETCDFVVAYDLETDTAFVIPVEKCEQVLSKSCDEEYAEAWHLLAC
jgi:hypothetical protein